MAGGHSTSRRSFLKMAPGGLALATGAATLTPLPATPAERVDYFTQELIKAWAEAYGGEPVVISHAGTSTMNRHVMIASKG